MRRSEVIDAHSWLEQYGKIRPSAASITDQQDIIIMGIWWGFWVYVQLEGDISDAVTIAMDAAWQRMSPLAHERVLTAKRRWLNDKQCKESEKIDDTH